MATRGNSWNDERESAQRKHGKRRAAGEGSIRQRPDGKWEARLTTSEGRKSFYGATQREVRDKLTHARHNLDQGIPIIADERQTVSAYLEKWLQHKSNLASSTRIRYAELFRHVTRIYGNQRLTQLTATNLETLYHQLQAPPPKGANLSSSTVHRVHSALHKALNDAVKLGALAINVTERVNTPKDARHVVEPFTLDEARRLLDAARGDRQEALYVLALATGARLGELLALTWSAVTLDGPQAGTMEIRASLRPCAPTEPTDISDTADASPTTKGPHARRERWELGPTKTSGSHRTVHLPPMAIDALRAHRARQLAERLAAGALWVERDLVFCDELGGFLDKSGVSRYHFHPLLKRAGLPRKRFHDLRHTTATLLLASGKGVKAVAGQLGHASVSTTGNIYGHITDEMRQDVASTLGALLRSNREA